MNLTDFDVLTFDCYGTLIDWEAGLLVALQPLLAAARVTLPPEAVLERFARHESAQEAATPAMIYSDLLTEVHRQLTAAFGATVPDAMHQALGASVPDWPAFPDSAAALRYLERHYKLVILSNVDRNSFRGSNRRLGVDFHAVYTAEDVGSYKPDPANFRYMLDRLAGQGIAPDRILHTAQSLFHDHAPARGLGLASAWIDRRHDAGGWGATMPAPGAGYDFRFPGMAELADAHRQALAAVRRE